MLADMRDALRQLRKAPGFARSFISKEGGAANDASLKQFCVSSFRLPVEVP